MKVVIEKSRMLEAPAHWVFFALCNPDIVSEITAMPPRMTPVEDNLFAGKLLGSAITMELLGDKALGNVGKVDLLVDVELPVGLGKTHFVSHYEYLALDASRTELGLHLTAEFRGIAVVFYFIFAKKHTDTHAARNLSNIAKAAMYMAEGEDVLGQSLSYSQLQRIGSFRGELQASPLGLGNSLEPANDQRDHQPDGQPGSRIWDAELLELSSLYRGLQSEADSLRGELDRISRAQDAVATLVSARRMLELIVTQLCETVLKRPRGTEPLLSIINTLNRTSEVPEHICASMNNLNRLSTFGAHPKSFNPRQVREALMGLCSIMEWYVTESKREKT